MCYLKNGSMVDIESTSVIGNILIQNGWTILTAINVTDIYSLAFSLCNNTHDN